MSETRQDKDRFDVVAWIIQYEDGELDEIEVIDGFQRLIDSSVAWGLQGSYGRVAQALIDAGHCTVQSQDSLDNGNVPAPKPEKIGTHCECGAGYVYLERHNAWGYACAR